MAASESAERRVYSVSQVNQAARRVLETQIGSIWVEGEISNLTRPASGHLYFSIKDDKAQVRAVIWRNTAGSLTFKPENGMQVQAYGNLTVYEAGGSYQIVVRKLEEGGMGSLHARFEKLKKQLLEEGLFSQEHKQALPGLSRHVGVVTSGTGAAIRDIFHVINRRYPNLHLVVAPVRVQGEGAAEEIAKAIEGLNKLGGLDCMIVGRGGGSIEDLWAFNEEVVARAIFASKIPVISAVGHETDTTISDFTADLRAATPSAAAELVVGRKEDFEKELHAVRRRLIAAIKDSCHTARRRYDVAAGHYIFREPRNMVEQNVQHLDRLSLRMRHSLEGRRRDVRDELEKLTGRMGPLMLKQTNAANRSLEQYGSRLEHLAVMRFQKNQQELSRLQAQLTALNPLAILDRGFSLTLDEKGNLVRAAGTLKQGERLSTRLASGTVISEVKETHEREEEK